MQSINVKGYGSLNFPDSMTQDDIENAIKSGISSGKLTPIASVDTSQTASPTDSQIPTPTDKAVGALLNPATPQENRAFLGNVALSAIPPLKVAKYLPEGANILKALANYGTDIAQNTALGAGASAISGGSPKQGALTGGLTAATINPLATTIGSGNPLIRIGAAGGLGLLGTLGAQNILGTDSKTADVIGAGIGAGLGLRGGNATDLATMNLLKDVDLNRAMPRIQAAQRLGLPFIRPSEAMDSGYIGSLEGSAGTSPEGALALEQKTEQRQAAEKSSIQKLMDVTFDPKTMTPEVDRLYKASYGASVTPQFFNNLTKSATIRAAMNDVDTDPVYQDALQGVPKTSFAYLDQVKRKLDAMAEGSPLAEAGLINDTKNNMLKRMDSINSSYKQARALAQRGIVRRDLLNVVNDDELKGSSFFRSALRNDDKFDDLTRGLKNVPTAQRQAQDMRDVFRTIVDSGKQTARSGVKLAATSMSSARSSYQAFLQKLQGGTYDKAMVDLMTSPNWHTQVKRAKEMATPSEKTRFIANAISRITGQKLNEVLYGN